MAALDDDIPHCSMHSILRGSLSTIGITLNAVYPYCKVKYINGGTTIYSVEVVRHTILLAAAQERFH